MKSKFDWHTLMAWILVIIVAGAIGLGIPVYTALRDRVTALEQNATPASVSDQKAALTFMKEEWETLVWVVGVIGACALGIGTFLGLKSINKAEALFSKKYRQELDERLRFAIEKDAVAKDKLIIFLYQPDELNRLKSTCDFFRMNGYRVKGVKAPPLNTAENIMNDLVADATVVVYQIDPDEAKHTFTRTENNNQIQSNQQNQALLYPVVAKVCETKRKHCIIYTGSMQIDRDELKKYENASVYNFPDTLRQALFTVLYFTA